MAATQKRRRAADAALTAVFSLISLAYVFPLIMVLLNSFKRKAYISRAPFACRRSNSSSFNPCILFSPSLYLVPACWQGCIRYT